MAYLLSQKQLASAALALVASFPANSAAASPIISLTNNEINGIEIANGGSIPANEVSAIRDSADALLPYTVVVRNTGSLPVTGIDIRYSLNRNGKEVSRDFLYLSHGDVASTTSLHIIPPGGQVVITPYHKANEEMLGRGSLSLSSEDITDLENAVGYLNASDQVTISVDSVIRSDGIMVGPDRCLRFQGFQQRISAYTEFRNELLKRFAAGEADSDIIACLRQLSSQHQVRKMNATAPDRAIMMTKMKAGEYLSYLTQGQRQHAWDQLKKATPERVLSQIYKIRQEGLT